MCARLSFLNYRAVNKKKLDVDLPSYDQLLNPLLTALHSLGGSASIAEMQDRVAEILRLPESETNKLYRGNRTHFNYRLAWARNYLKHFGVIQNSSRGIWALTDRGQSIRSVNKEEVKQFVKSLASNAATTDEASPALNLDRWQDKVIQAVLKMSPAAFERLCQRLLREAGFTRVEITGRSGDGGIDGRGIMQMGGLLSFHVMFQCKRYAGSVPAKDVREFRGAMVGRPDKGLFITTGTFTRDALKEATRDGAPPIDLVDGEQLAEKLRELRLGVSTKTEEVVIVEPSWFQTV